MKKEFIDTLFKSHRAVKEIPSPAQVCNWLNGLLKVLFPELADRRYRTLREFENHCYEISLELFTILEILGDSLGESPARIETLFLDQLPAIRETLLQDAESILKGDPAAVNKTEVIRTYPGFHALAVYRLAHVFYRLGVPLIPRILTEHAHSQTGVDIHPGAVIGERFCIDHGTGVVIGETVEIGNDVKVYQGVTLGALSVTKEMAKTKRHPTIGDRVIIYAGATILGGETFIGNDSVIGGNVWITKTIPPYSRVYYQGKLRQQVVQNATPKV